MARPLPPVVWTNVRGMNNADPPTRLPEDMAVQAFNILLEPQSLGRRRPSMAAVSLTSGPTTVIEQLVRYQPAVTKTGAGGAELWAFSGTSTVHRLANGTWASVTASDTVTSWATSRPYGATLNGKLFLAYNSDVNRLHVWDGTSCRRVGIAASAAATVANTGAGAYAATLRYYKIQWKIISGSTTVATSELSASVSFTPSGGGTAARVTKPTTPDSATHWIVFGSSDNVAYYDISGDTLVATTTYDDSAAPSSYADGDIAPTAGLYVPPPAAKYLLATDNRLFLAGCHETTASAGQTATRNSRVWFTQVLGALDNTGEDEAIAQTTDLKDWVDCGENDGDAVVGLGGPIDGAVFVFKDRSIWRLSPTGNSDTPYRADRISPSIGATWQDAITVGEDGNGNPALCFMSLTGPKRIVSGYGIEDIGADVRNFSTAAYSNVDDTPIAVWDAVRRVVWWIAYDQQAVYGFQPQFESRDRFGTRGGWTQHTISNGGNTTRSATLYELNGVLVPYLGGESALSAGTLASLSGGSRADVTTTDLSSSVKSPIFQPGGLLNRVGFGHAVLEWDYSGETTNAHTVAIASAIGGPLAVVGTVTDTATDAAYSQGVIQEKLESLQLSDVFGLQITVTWDASADGDERPRIHGVTVPITAQEGA